VLLGSFRAAGATANPLLRHSWPQPLAGELQALCSRFSTLLSSSHLVWAAYCKQVLAPEAWCMASALVAVMGGGNPEDSSTSPAAWRRMACELKSIELPSPEPSEHSTSSSESVPQPPHRAHLRFEREADRRAYLDALVHAVLQR
jgi:hypothetical protein